jgi:SsrA-binding protein
MIDMGKAATTSPRILNRKARFNYEILERLEAGIALTGSEVKSLRAGKASLDEAYAYENRAELMLLQCNISPYANAGYAQHAPTRPRKLLLHRRELNKWLVRVKEKGYSIIPTAIYFNERGIAKVELALGRGKDVADKRDSLRERDTRREMDRAMKRR